MVNLPSPTNWSRRRVTMSLTPSDLNPDHVWLEMPEQLNSQIQAMHSSSVLVSQQDHTHLNQICEVVLQSYLKEHLPDAHLPAIQEDLWNLGVNGIGIESSAMRLVFIPSEAWDLDGLQVPQEWVDIPDLASDYYVAVQVDREDGMVRLWGVTTHKTLKEQGLYNARNRSYHLDRDALTETLNGVWLQRKYFPQTALRGDIAPLHSPRLDALTQAWDILSKPVKAFFRRRIAFTTWASILTNPQWRQHAISLLTASPEPSEAVQLNQWLNHQFEQGWQSINQLIAPRLVGAFMDTQIKRAKLIDLGVELGGCQVSLMMTIAATEQGMNLQASVYPTGEELTLPPNLHLRILTEVGEVFKEVTSRSDDEFIRYRFDAAIGDRLTIQVALGSACISECFQI